MDSQNGVEINSRQYKIDEKFSKVDAKKDKKSGKNGKKTATRRSQEKKEGGEEKPEKNNRKRIGNQSKNEKKRSKILKKTAEIVQFCETKNGDSTFSGPLDLINFGKKIKKIAGKMVVIKGLEKDIQGLYEGLDILDSNLDRKINERDENIKNASIKWFFQESEILKKITLDDFVNKLKIVADKLITIKNMKEDISDSHMSLYTLEIILNHIEQDRKRQKKIQKQDKLNHDNDIDINHDLDDQTVHESNS